MMLDDTRSRFLAAIAKRVAAERVIEVHLFSGLRQGGTESGVAVLAVEHEPIALRDVDIGVGVPARPEAPSVASRYVVYSARYRLTLKGVDRGKWEVTVTEEADAPLLTVDAVVRGVQRRSGDADETVRLSGDEFRASLPPLVAAG